jgi:hypothetical protein
LRLPAEAWRTQNVERRGADRSPTVRNVVGARTGVKRVCAIDGAAIGGMRQNRRAERASAGNVDTTQIPIVGLEAAMAHAQAYLRTPTECTACSGNCPGRNDRAS